LVPALSSWEIKEGLACNPKEKKLVHYFRVLVDKQRHELFKFIGSLKKNYSMAILAFTRNLFCPVFRKLRMTDSANSLLSIAGN
jgi:hypothetical protein